jgi:IclR family pca regulon transcriptional regulator
LDKAALESTDYRIYCPIIEHQTSVSVPQSELAGFSGNPDFMMSLARGLHVLQLIVASERPMTLAEVSRRSGLSRAAARRALYTLSQLGHVKQVERGFILGNAALFLGRGFVPPHSLAAKAQPLLDALRDELSESCSLGVLDEDHVRYVARAEASRIMSITLRIGSRLPLYPTSMGRILLAGMEPAQRQEYFSRVSPTPLTPQTVTEPQQLARILDGVAKCGFAIVDQELENGLRSASVPILSRSGQVIAALNVGTAAARIPMEQLRSSFVPALQRCATTIAAMSPAA